jgi:uncharacterized protein (DUF305 family)
MRFQRSVIFVLPAVAAIALTGCGSSSGPKSTTTETVATVAAAAPTPETSPVVVDAAFNAGDVTFAQGMIPHHQQAVEMAAMALDPARKAGPSVTDLATRIKGAQGPEIALMTSWLTTWNQPMMAGMKPGETMPPGATMPPMAGMEGMGTEGMGTEAMAGMMSAADITALSKASGPEFDKMWLTMMVKHHDGAITMSKTVQTDGQSADVKTLAGKIITAQMAEIDEMKKLAAG